MNDTKLRLQLAKMLVGRQAHLDFAELVADIPAELRGVRPKAGLHTAWQLLEHLRICQWDILEFSRDPNHDSPEWPAGYWPPSEAPPDPSSWDQSVAAFKNDQAAMHALVLDTDQDLWEPFPHGDGQTLLREALLVIKHNSYHLGQLATLRRLLGIGT